METFYSYWDFLIGEVCWSIYWWSETLNFEYTTKPSRKELGYRISAYSIRDSLAISNINNLIWEHSISAISNIKKKADIRKGTRGNTQYQETKIFQYSNADIGVCDRWCLRLSVDWVGGVPGVTELYIPGQGRGWPRESHLTGFYPVQITMKLVHTNSYYR